MGKSNTEQLNIAKKYLGQGGSKFRKFCGLPAGAAWCDAFVTTIFAEAGNSSLFCSGSKQTYCPTTISICRKNLAEVPPYLALPSDIIFFDWEPNSVPNHIGFVRERKDCEAIYTIEGNTSGGIVANKLRSTKYVCGIYRPHFKATYKIGKLTVDGYFGYNSIAMLQKALGVGVDGILGQQTVKALQRKCGASADGLWGRATSKAVQKWLGVTVDGYFGPNSVKALQRWINKVTSSSPSLIDKELDACKTQSVWMKNAAYKWESNPTIEKSKKKGTCVTYVACVLQRLGILKSGEYIWQNGKGYGNGKVYGTNSKMAVTYMGNKTISSLKSKLKTGDIILLDDNKSGVKGSGGHIFILAGWNGTTPIIWDNETSKKGQKARTYNGSRKVLAVVRLK